MDLVESSRFLILRLHIVVFCPNKLPCQDSKFCIPVTEKCDGKPDCEDSSDEEGCGMLSSVYAHVLISRADLGTSSLFKNISTDVNAQTTQLSPPSPSLDLPLIVAVIFFSLVYLF